MKFNEQEPSTLVPSLLTAYNNLESSTPFYTPPVLDYTTELDIVKDTCSFLVDVLDGNGKSNDFYSKYNGKWKVKLTKCLTHVNQHTLIGMLESFVDIANGIDDLLGFIDK